jgi:hypothetical protein
MLSCTPAIDHNHSIVVDGRLLIGQRADRITDNSPVTSELENPIITGSISLPGNLRESGVTRERGFARISCCERLMIGYPAATQNLLSSIFISVLSNSSLSVSGMRMYLYASPSVSLPADGSSIEARLSTGDGLLVSGRIQLDPDVIVLPVYAHVFTDPERDLPSWFDKDSVASCFDGNRFAPPMKATPDLVSLSPRPSFLTTGESHSRPGERIETTIFTQILTSPYTEPDSIWKQAHIQFRLIEYISEENVALARQIIDPVESRMATAAYHADYVKAHPDKKGIHIYFGRNSMHIGTGGAITAGRTDGPSCDGRSVGSRYHLDLAVDEAAGNLLTLAHELGHFLGLDHVEGLFSDTDCGRRILDPGEAPSLNLMFRSSATDKTHLSAGQITAARRVACAYIRFWELPSVACR